jgi:hypothetical protein
MNSQDSANSTASVITIPSAGASSRTGQAAASREPTRRDEAPQSRPAAAAGQAAQVAGQPAPAAGSGRVPRAVWVIAAVLVAVELALSSRYGFLQDELYFIEAGRHLAFGYVDQPPLAPLLTRITDVLGVNPTAIRIVPALAGGAVVVIAARFAALFGGGRFGQVLAALSTVCAPLVFALAHLGITEQPDLLAWAVVLLCVTTALLRDRPRLWLGAGLAAGIGLEANNVMLLLLLGLAAGLPLAGRGGVLRSRWPWLGAGIAAVIWAPNIIWQATHGWPQLAMATVLHQDNTSTTQYVLGLPTLLGYGGLVTIPLFIAGFVWLWRNSEVRFIAVGTTIIALYVLLWVPGKEYYCEGTGVALLAAGAVATERWIARGGRPRLRRGLAVAAPLLSMALSVPSTLPVVPAGDLHDIQNLDTITTADTFGWPQLTRAVVAEAAALKRAGEAPTSVFTSDYAEAGALDVLGPGDHLPPVLSGHNTYWLWGPGRASDRTVLVVDAFSQLRPYFASCRVLTTYRVPDHVPSDFNNLQIGVCTGPSAGWHTLWPRLKHFD